MNVWNIGKFTFLAAAIGLAGGVAATGAASAQGWRGDSWRGDGYRGGYHRDWDRGRHWRRGRDWRRPSPRFGYAPPRGPRCHMEFRAVQTPNGLQKRQFRVCR